MKGVVNSTIEHDAFNKIFKQYLLLSKREIAETLNAKAYFIACNSTDETKKILGDKIEADLRGPSKVNSSVPLGAILVNMQRGKSGKKGLYGQKMSMALQKLINVKKRSAAYVASSWVGSIKDLAPYVRSKMGKKKNSLTKTLKQPQSVGYPIKGASANAAVQKVVIENNIKQKKVSPRLMSVLLEGSQKAFDREAKSMLDYMSKKLDAMKLR